MCCISGDTELQVELTAKQTALLVGDTITVTCLARGSEILEDHWKYPGKVVRTECQSPKEPHGVIVRSLGTRYMMLPPCSTG